VLLIGLVLGLLRLIYFLAVQAKNSAQKATVPQKVLSAAKVLNIPCLEQMMSTCP
jgi:hypothetical protein